MSIWKNFLNEIKSFFTLETWVSSDEKYGRIDEELNRRGQ